MRAASRPMPTSFHRGPDRVITRSARNGHRQYSNDLPNDDVQEEPVPVMQAVARQPLPSALHRHRDAHGALHRLGRDGDRRHPGREVSATQP